MLRAFSSARGSQCHQAGWLSRWQSNSSIRFKSYCPTLSSSSSTARQYPPQGPIDDRLAYCFLFNFLRCFKSFLRRIFSPASQLPTLKCHWKILKACPWQKRIEKDRRGLWILNHQHRPGGQRWQKAHSKPLWHPSCMERKRQETHPTRPVRDWDLCQQTDST